MAGTVTSESKTILKKILVGVTTTVVTTAVIYFLGFNRSAAKATPIEVKKNTIKAWREYVRIENNVQPLHDSNLARVQRVAISFPAYRKNDSTVSANFIKELNKLKETKDIDNDFKLLLTERIGYKKQEMTNFFAYYDEFIALRDSAIALEYKNYLVQELNTSMSSKRANFVERVGRSLEDMAKSLSKKYQYPFSITDFNFNVYYQTLKKAKKPLGTDPSTELPE